VGEENRGWYIGTTTLDFERSNIATSVSHGLMVRDLIDYARSREGDPSVARARTRTMQLELTDRLIESEVEQLFSYAIVSIQARGLVPNKEASIAKLFGSELDVRIAGTALKLFGLYGQLDRGSPYAPLGGRPASVYMYATTSPIGGGTSEIQRNIIAQRGLGLPRA
jgi:alkylation response protein AidB-like acyl-CoA dehydrogenase